MHLLRYVGMLGVSKCFLGKSCFFLKVVYIMSSQSPYNALNNATGPPTYVASTVGPASIPLKQADNNNETHASMGMPFKPNTMAQGNMFSMFRRAYVKKSGGGEGFFDSSQYIALKKINATGKSSTNYQNNVMSFSGVDPNSVREAKKYCRAGGCVAPKKKGATF